MQPLHDSRSRDRQMPVPSPRCILNCQALSIHLPPLPEPRDHSSRNKYLTSPISASPKQYSDSPTSTQSLSNRQISAQPRGGHSINRRPQDLDRRVSTPKSNADVDSRRSLPLNNDLQHSREDSVNELSSVTQDSPEAQQLAAGPPGIARRAKAHVPSACVNCKRKHLACETKRPCNRCIQTGKESTCVDVQHKKRGRPRLREEESLRDVEFGREYAQEENYSTPNGILSVPQIGRRRSKTYRELRSHENFYGDSRSDPGYLIQQPLSVTTTSQAFPASYLSENIPTVLLTSEFLVAQHNNAFVDALSLSYSAKGQPLTDLVIPSEREKIQRLQTILRAELVDSSHISKIHGQYENSNGMPAIENLELENRVRSEYCTFRLPKGQSRRFPIIISLANNGSPFIILTLVQSSNAIMLPSPHLNQTVRGQPLASPSSLIGPGSPIQDRHLIYNHSHHRNGNSHGNNPYANQLSPQKSPGSDNRTLLMQPSPNVGLDQYRQPTPARTTGSQYIIGNPVSSPGASRALQIQPQDLSGGNMRHLQLPPIRTTGTGISESSRSSNEGKADQPRGKQSPGKGSPQSSRKKKRRRVELGDILR